MLLFAYDYQGNKLEFTVDEEFDFLNVTVVSGDEIVEVCKNGGPGEPPTCITCCDSSSDRLQDFYDAAYCVPRDEVDNWLKRVGSYDMRW